DDLPGGVAAHDRIVDDDDALAGHDLAQRIELHPQAAFSELLPRLDEGPGDVAVLDQAVVLVDARGAREPVRGGVARIRNRDDEVRVHGRLAPQDLAHPPANLLDDPAPEPRIGAV